MDNKEKKGALDNLTKLIEHRFKGKHDKINYGTNLLDILGYNIMRNIQHNVKTKPVDIVLKDVIPKHKELMNLIEEAKFYINYSPKEDYNLRLERNPGGFMDPEYKVTASFPINIKGI